MATPAQIAVSTIDTQTKRRQDLQDEARKQVLEYNWGVINNPSATPEQIESAKQNIHNAYPTPFHAVQFLGHLMGIKNKQQQAQSAANVQPNPSAPASVPAPGDSGTESTTPGPANVQNPVQAIQGGAVPRVAPQASQPSLDQVRAVAQAPTAQAAHATISQGKQPSLGGYASPQDIQNQFELQRMAKQNEYNQAIWGQRIAGNLDVKALQIEYQKMNTPQKMVLESGAQGLGYGSFYSAPPQVQAQLLTQFHMANAPKIQTDFVQDANSPTGWSRATYNPVTQETYDVYPGVKPPPGLVARHRVTTTPGPNGMVTTVSDITPSLPGGQAQPFVAPPSKESKTNPGGPQGTPKAPVSATTPAGPLEGVSTPPNGGAVNSIAPPPQEAGTAPTSTATAAAAPPVNAGARQPGTKPQGAAVKGPKLAPPVPQRPDSEGEDIPPLRRPDLPPLKGADEARIASITAPVHTVEAQVVGRGRKPLWELGEVLKDPNMLRAVNTAMLAPMLQTPEGNHNISFWGTIATSLGLASAAQQATSDVITEARNKVRQEGGEDALRLLDRLAELKGTIPNLRKVQGGSNAMGALEPLYQESPLMNISSPEDFRFRTANMLRTMADSLSEQPGVNRKHVDWLYGQADKAEKGIATNTPAQKSSKVDDFLKNFGK